MGEIRFVGTGETRGYPYPVCKKMRVNCNSYTVPIVEWLQILGYGEESCWFPACDLKTLSVYQAVNTVQSLCIGTDSS